MIYVAYAGAKETQCICSSHSGTETQPGMRRCKPDIKQPSRIVFGLERRDTICEKTAAEIIQLLMTLAHIELLISY